MGRLSKSHQGLTASLGFLFVLTLNSCGVVKTTNKPPSRGVTRNAADASSNITTNVDNSSSTESGNNITADTSKSIETKAIQTDQTTPVCKLTVCPDNQPLDTATCSCGNPFDQVAPVPARYLAKCGSPVSRGLCSDGSMGVLSEVPPQSEPYCDDIGAELNKSCTRLNEGCVERKAVFCPDGKPLNNIGGLQCVVEGPVKGFSRCPISSRDFKTSIHYVNEKEARQISRGILNLKIANYQYNEKTNLSGEPALGFIIEDYPSLPYARSQSKAVDQYSYISAAVVTIQSQQAEIESLRKRLEQLEKKLEGQTKDKNSRVK